MGRYCLLWLLDSEPSGMGTDTGSWECMCSFRSRVAPSEKGPVGTGGSHPGQRQGHSVKVPSCQLCSVSYLHSPASPAEWVSKEAPG